MVIKAKMNEENDEVERLLKQVREARQLRKNQRIDKSKAITKIEQFEENNNGLVKKVRYC
jgi:predicted nucleotidyltransferase